MEKDQLEHLKGKQKELRNKSNKEEVVFNNKNIMYQGNTSVVLDKQGRKHTEEQQAPARNPNDASLSDNFHIETTQRW